MLQAVAIFLFIMAILSGLITYISAHNNPLKIPDLTKPGSIATVVLFVASIITGLWSPVSIYGDCSDVAEEALTARKDFLEFQLTDVAEGQTQELVIAPKDAMNSFFEANEGCFEIPEQRSIRRVNFAGLSDDEVNTATEWITEHLTDFNVQTQHQFINALAQPLPDIPDPTEENPEQTRKLTAEEYAPVLMYLVEFENWAYRMAEDGTPMRKTEELLLDNWQANGLPEIQGFVDYCKLADENKPQGALKWETQKYIELTYKIAKAEDALSMNVDLEKIWKSYATARRSRDKAKHQDTMCRKVLELDRARSAEVTAQGPVILLRSYRDFSQLDEEIQKKYWSDLPRWNKALEDDPSDESSHVYHTNMVHWTKTAADEIDCEKTQSTIGPYGRGTASKRRTNQANFLTECKTLQAWRAKSDESEAGLAQLITWVDNGQIEIDELYENLFTSTDLSCESERLNANRQKTEKRNLAKFTQEEIDTIVNSEAPMDAGDFFTTALTGPSGSSSILFVKERKPPRALGRDTQYTFGLTTEVDTENSGIRITAVHEGLAEEFQVGDIITAVNDTTVFTQQYSYGLELDIVSPRARKKWDDTPRSLDEKDDEPEAKGLWVTSVMAAPKDAGATADPCASPEEKAAAATAAEENQSPRTISSDQIIKVGDEMVTADNALAMKAKLEATKSASASMENSEEVLTITVWREADQRAAKKAKGDKDKIPAGTVVEIVQNVNLTNVDELKETVDLAGADNSVIVSLEIQRAGEALGGAVELTRTIMVDNSNVINFANFPQVRDTIYKELIIESLASSELNESIGQQNVEKYATQAIDIELACYEAVQADRKTCNQTQAACDANMLGDQQCGGASYSEAEVSEMMATCTEKRQQCFTEQQEANENREDDSTPTELPESCKEQNAVCGEAVVISCMVAEEACTKASITEPIADIEARCFGNAQEEVKRQCFDDQTVVVEKADEGEEGEDGAEAASTEKTEGEG